MNQTKYRFSSNLISSWTSDVHPSIFFHLLTMENRAFAAVADDESPFDSLPSRVFHLMTSVKPNDFRSLLGNELPGFSIYDTEILIAGEGTDFTNLPVESSFPLEDVLEEREAEYENDTGEDEQKEIPSVDEQRNVVFIYNTHNRESFLPHLPDITNPDLAHHSEVNITLVSERLKQSLQEKGIGAIVDETDIIGEVLVQNNWEYWQSYEASREVVSEAFAQHKDLQYAIDIHRDGISRDLTTKNINGENYAKVMFVIGKDNPAFKKNYQLANNLHNRLKEKYPGLSRGAVQQGGSGNNGIYNQDLTENALLLEIGGVGNTLEETYRTIDVIAEVFSEYYWDAEAVQGSGG
ncbi:stage II sporulation protein P [Oceanobacillus sp. CAU 1775]